MTRTNEGDNTWAHLTGAGEMVKKPFTKPVEKSGEEQKFVEKTTEAVHGAMENLLDPAPKKESQTAFLTSGNHAQRTW